MRFAVSPVGLLLVGSLLLPAGTFGAEKILYATAASQARIDRFPIDGSGLMASDPTAMTSTGTDPRRLLVVGCFLYVGEDDRVEAFRIGKNGALTRWASTPIVQDMRATDLAVWPPQRLTHDPANNTARMLYVTETGQQRVVAYTLQPNGSGEPALRNRTECSCNRDQDCNGAAGSCVEKRCTSGTSPSPCASGETYTFGPSSCAAGPAEYLGLAVHSNRLYAGGNSFDPEVDGFKLDADGNLMDARTDTLAEVCASSTQSTGSCACTGPADCNGSPGSCVSGRCIGATRPCGEGPTCAERRTCLPSGLCACDGPDDCDGTEGSCANGQCSSATRACDPTAVTEGAGSCAAGQQCLLNGRPTPEWCVRRVHGARIAIDELDSVNHLLFITDRIFGRITAFRTPLPRPETFAGATCVGGTVPAGTSCTKDGNCGNGGRCDLGFPNGGALRDRITPNKAPCTKGAACTCSTSKKFRPKLFNVDPDRKDMVKTIEGPFYEALLHYAPNGSSADGAFLPSTLFGTEFQRGRVDAYTITPDPTKRFISKQPKKSEEDVRMSPVGMVAVDDVLYVAAGEQDRIRAYRLRRKKNNATTLTQIGETNDHDDTFPNDVAVVVPSACEQ